MGFLNSDFVKAISVITDLIALFSFLYAIGYGIINKNKTVIGFQIANYISSAFKVGILILALTLLFKICELFYLFSIVLFKGSSDNYWWENGKEIHHIVAYFVFILFFLSLSWVAGTAIWTSSLNQTKLFLNLFLPKNTQLSLNHFKTLSIIEAKYGANNSYFDITDKLRKMIEGNILNITASNEIAGDPIFGTEKKIILKYKYDGEDLKTIEITENKSETIRPSTT